MILNLKQARRLRDKTQEDMADLLKIHVQSYQKLEKNPELVTIEQAKKIAEFLGFTYDEIFFGVSI